MADGPAYLESSLFADIHLSYPFPKDTESTESTFDSSIDAINQRLPSYLQQRLTEGSDRLKGPERRMYSQGPGQGHNPRPNGASAGRGGMPMQLYNYQQQNLHQHQGHGQHHQAMQPDHAGHNGNGNVMGHHQSYSSGLISSSSPFSQSAMQNGHGGATRTGQTQQINEHWADILRLHKESQQAHISMVENGAVNYYARLRASDNRGIVLTPNASKEGDESSERNGRVNAVKEPKPQAWHNLDLSGQGLRNLALPLFDYRFLQELYICSNKLTHIPRQIGLLRDLKVLDASNNLLTELPAEVGMCTYLKTLLLFDNQIRTLPYELGSLHQLEVLGIEGNPVNSEMRQEIQERGTKSLITQLREQAPGKRRAFRPTQFRNS
jgi:CCR4-NOT transcription complex subunit 6